MTKLNKKYVIGTHIMFFEIEMYKDFIDGMINLLETVETKENVTIDLCLNLSEVLEKIDTDKIGVSEISLSYWIIGQRNPSRDHLRSLSKLLRCKMSDLEG